MANAERITRALQGHWHGHYGTAMCPAHQNTQTPALSMSDGDDGRLLLKCHAGCSFSEVMKALGRMGLAKVSLAQKRESVSINPSQAPKAQRNAAQARQLWQQARPIKGTQAEAYLWARGLEAPSNHSLRYHPTCWHAPRKRHYPAIIALVTGGRDFAIHRTYLCDTKPQKADVAPNKMMLGPAARGAVRLSAEDGPLILAEGIETALSLRPSIIGVRGSIWAALSTSGLQSLDLPKNAHRLIIATDGDHAGWKAGLQLKQRAQALGWAVEIHAAPTGLDWNDILMKKERS